MGILGLGKRQPGVHLPEETGGQNLVFGDVLPPAEESDSSGRAIVEAVQKLRLAGSMLVSLVQGYREQPVDEQFNQKV